MKILICHNRYQQAGGEDAVVKTECELLNKFGQDVQLYERNNSELSQGSLFKKLSFPIEIQGSKDSYQHLRSVLRSFKPDIVNFHNIHFVMTPSVYEACYDENVPVVQSLHNFRLMCANGLFFRNNQVCEECVEKNSLWRGVVHKCYKDSRLMTAFIVNMLRKHWKKGTWTNRINAYIIATEFGRKKYIEAGIPEKKIFIKPNFFYLNEETEGYQKDCALYVGRLSEEKGIKTLVQAWKQIKELKLFVLGDGPLKGELERMVDKEGISNVEFLGFVSDSQYREYMMRAQFVIIPSECYENFPRVVAEAYTFGIPMIASNIGSFPELVVEGVSGKLFRTSDSNDLAEKVKWFLSNPKEIKQMRKNVGEIYREKYTAEKLYQRLKEIYCLVIERKHESRI